MDSAFADIRRQREFAPPVTVANVEEEAPTESRARGSNERRAAGSRASLRSKVSKASLARSQASLPRSLGSRSPGSDRSGPRGSAARPDENRLTEQSIQQEKARPLRLSRSRRSLEGSQERPPAQVTFET